jgi:hypothetical protein
MNFNSFVLSRLDGPLLLRRTSRILSRSNVIPDPLKLLNSSFGHSPPFPKIVLYNIRTFAVNNFTLTQRNASHPMVLVRVTRYTKSFLLDRLCGMQQWPLITSRTPLMKLQVQDACTLCISQQAYTTRKLPPLILPEARNYSV